ncbi:hypothetical protein [Pseudomonas sp.]|jgi:hypothetical protein|uniref:hypothetical protein n=1 Tax=Pseudomonas sp. TaxID=306 RepID=UPI002EDB0892
MSQPDTRKTPNIIPVIVGVVDGNLGYVERDGITSNRSMHFMLVGTSSPNCQVEVHFKKNEGEWLPQPGIIVNAKGSWHMAYSLSTGDSGSFKAKDPQSGEWSDIYKITVLPDGLGEAKGTSAV